jgi:hypothetical protein
MEKRRARKNRERRIRRREGEAPGEEGTAFRQPANSMRGYKSAYPHPENKKTDRQVKSPADISRLKKRGLATAPRLKVHWVMLRYLLSRPGKESDRAELPIHSHTLYPIPVRKTPLKKAGTDPAEAAKKQPPAKRGINSKSTGFLPIRSAIRPKTRGARVIAAYWEATITPIMAGPRTKSEATLSRTSWNPPFSKPRKKVNPQTPGINKLRRFSSMVQQVLPGGFFMGANPKPGRFRESLVVYNPGPDSRA